MEASSAVSELVPKTEHSHAIAENLVLRCCRKMNRIMIGDQAVKPFEKLPSSDYNVSRDIDDVCSDVLKQLRHNGIKNEVFALQPDEYTNFKKKAQLPAKVRYTKGETIKDFLYRRELLHKLQKKIYGRRR